MNFGEAIQRVQSLYSRGVQSKDSRLTPRHIYSALTTGRSILLRQRADKRQIISDWCYQVLPCVELIQVDPSECPCVPPSGCMVLRTKHKIPKPITSLDKNLFSYVTSLDGSIIFDEDSYKNHKYARGNKYTANNPKFYPKNGYIYITVLKHLKALTMGVLVDDFVAAYNFPTICTNCPECDCVDIMEMDFPLEGDLMDALLKISYNELIILMSQIPQDKNNDATETTQNNGMIHQPQQ